MCLGDEHWFDILIQSLPAWAEKAIAPNGIMDYIAKFNFKLSSNTPQLARLKFGYFIKEIFRHFSQKISSNLRPNRSLWLYSAHDFTIANILNSFGLFEVFPTFQLTETSETNDAFFYTFYFDSYTSHRMDQVYISNSTKPMNLTKRTEINITFSFCTGVQGKIIHCHWKFRDVERNAR